MTGWNDIARRLLFLPEQATAMATQIDHLHYFVIACTMIGSGLCGLTALYFVIRYHRRRAPSITPRVVGGWKFEAAVITFPLALFLFMWVIGFRQFIALSTPPPDSLDVYVQGKKWMWKFAYPGGPSSINTLHVPAGRPVRLLITARDVIHSFYVPDFRIKQDALPGRYTEIWFQAIGPGTHQIFCAELCGVGHSTMWGEIIVHEPAEFEEWLANQRRGLAGRQDGGDSDSIPTAADIVKQGERLATEVGCMKCHSIDGTPHIGPTFRDLYLRKETMQSGAAIVADEAYITQSIMDPMAQIVAGYTPVMPTFQGRLGPPELAAIIEYIKSLRATAGTKSYRNQGSPYEPAEQR